MKRFLLDKSSIKGLHEQLIVCILRRIFSTFWSFTMYAKYSRWGILKCFPAVNKQIEWLTELLRKRYYEPTYP